MSGKQITCRVSGDLEKHVEEQVSNEGLYESTSEYLRDLIRRDITERHAGWSWLRAHLEPGLRAKDSEFIHLTADELIERNKARQN